MWPHLLVTLTEVLIGFAVGIASGLIVGGALISLVPVIEKLVYPYLVALQTVPAVAVAPLLVIWFGYGLTSKVVITAPICFFPILVSVISGFHSTDRDQLDMMKAYGRDDMADAAPPADSFRAGPDLCGARNRIRSSR